jgi:hypothetical protein
MMRAKAKRAEVKEGQKVSWKLRSFGFREAVRNRDESALEALQVLVGRAFNELRELDSSGEDGAFDFGYDDMLEEQKQVVETIITDIDDTAATDNAAKAEQAEFLKDQAAGERVPSFAAKSRL